MVNYLDSRRIMGTTAERSSIPVPATQGGWVELGRTTLGSSGDTIPVSSLPDKRYYMFLYSGVPSGDVDVLIRFNSDSGNNYAYRKSDDGLADGTNVPASFQIAGDSNISGQHLSVGYTANLSTNEKLSLAHFGGTSAAGAGTAPNRQESASKWVNTSAAINKFDLINLSSGDLGSGSELVVLGWDPADTHTNNFWEELASVELGSPADQISSGTITAKKYLWIQCWIKNDSANDITGLLRFNNDTGTNYSSRYSINGGTDVTRTSRTYIDSTGGSQEATLINAFIINNASNEKLMIGHNIGSSTAGAANAPNRREWVGKWANTSNQITEIDVEQLDAGDLASGSILKVWGAD